MSEVALGGVKTAEAVEPASSRVASLADSVLAPAADLRPRLLGDFGVAPISMATSPLVSAVLAAAGFFEREPREDDFAITVSDSASATGRSLVAGFADLAEVFDAALGAVALGAAFLAADTAGFRVAEVFGFETGLDAASSGSETGAFESLLFTISGVLQAA